MDSSKSLPSIVGLYKIMFAQLRTKSCYNFQAVPFEQLSF